jgi:hypothetical protein
MATIRSNGMEQTTGKRVYVEIVLADGAPCRVWITENCAVIEANGLVTSAARTTRGLGHMSTERAAELAPLLAAAAVK